jgi:LPS-assembly lipoprotein
MSSPEASVFKTLRGAAVFAAFAALSIVSACTVRPLYSNPSSDGTQAGVTADLSSIAIKPVETRYAQEVRNHLIFAFNGGSGQPAGARYTLALVVTAQNESAAVVQVAKENEPTAGTVTVTARYVLTETETGKAVADGRRQISSSYDVPRQEFAADRARRDAENRAARELAELLRLAIAQDLTRATQ